MASIVLVGTLAGSATETTAQGRIAFSDRVYYANADSWEIFVVRPDGSGLRRVTHVGKRLFDSINPAWSPDGRRIVFQSSARIFVMDANGKRLRQLTIGKVNDGAPAWSPSGGRIAFERRNAIWTMRADGKVQRRLTRNEKAHQPTWSPDGRRILFVGGRDIWVIGASGGKARKLVANASDPSWSPDGRRIAFDGSNEGGIFVVNADGTGRRRLGDGEDPSWSPDGRRIAFSYRGISVMDADGGNPRVIVRGYPEMFGPAWGRG
jgi:eukaryotic-like serine/threonine-protein kinase